MSPTLYEDKSTPFSDAASFLVRRIRTIEGIDASQNRFECRDVMCRTHACMRGLHVLYRMAVGDGRALDGTEIDGGLDAPDGEANQLQQHNQPGGAHPDDALHGASSVRERCQPEIDRNYRKITRTWKDAGIVRYKFDAPATSLD